MLALVLGILATGYYLKGGWVISAMDLAAHGPYSVSQRVEEYGKSVEARLGPDFASAGITYPPKKAIFVVLKQEREMQIYAKDSAGEYRFIRSYPILAASGHLGPKLREGDEQVPEGIYGVESLNPNSHYHLALHVDYPNAFDRAEGQADGRKDLGGDIMIHGNHVSIGCIAVGDAAAEDLFVLAAQVGLPNIRLIICPFDFRLTKKALAGPDLPNWTPKLYAQLERALAGLPVPPNRHDE